MAKITVFECDVCKAQSKKITSFNKDTSKTTARAIAFCVKNRHSPFSLFRRNPIFLLLWIINWLTNACEAFEERLISWTFPDAPSV